MIGRLKSPTKKPGQCRSMAIGINLEYFVEIKRDKN